MIKSVLVVISAIGVAIAQNSNSHSDNQQNVARKNSELRHLNGTKVHTEIYNQHDGNRIVFPNEETNKNRMPTHDRTPVTDPSCGEHELLYPGDNEGDWACDCKPGYLHYPLTSKCYEAYTQGPCKNGQLLILDGRTTNSIPKCVHNKCGKGMVEFQTQCFTLHEEGGCQQYKVGLGRTVILTINPTTNGLICATEDLAIECADQCCIGRNGNIVPPGYVCEKTSPTVPAQQPRPQPKPSQGNSQQFNSQNSGRPQNNGQQPFSQGSNQQQPVLQFPSAQSNTGVTIPPQGVQPPYQRVPTQQQTQQQQGSGQQTQFQSQNQQPQFSNQKPQPQFSNQKPQPQNSNQQPQPQFSNQKPQPQFSNQQPQQPLTSQQRFQNQQAGSNFLPPPSQAQIQAQQNEDIGKVVVAQVDEFIQNNQGKGPQPLTDAQRGGNRVLS